MRRNEPAKQMGVASPPPSEMKMEWVPIDSVKLWGDNPRRNDKAAEQLAELIKEHGVRSPLVVWRKNKTVYKGNTTLKALKLLGWTKVPVLFHDFQSEAAAKAYGIADNKSSEYAGWDKDILAGIMKSQPLLNLALDRDGLKRVTGFTEREIEGLVNPPEPSELPDLVSGKRPFVVIEFEDEDAFEEFQRRVSKDKVIDFSKLNEGMGYYADT